MFPGVGPTISEYSEQRQLRLCSLQINRIPKPCAATNSRAAFGGSSPRGARAAGQLGSGRSRRRQHSFQNSTCGSVEGGPAKSKLGQNIVPRIDRYGKDELVRTSIIDRPAFRTSIFTSKRASLQEVGWFRAKASLIVVCRSGSWFLKSSLLPQPMPVLL